MNFPAAAWDHVSVWLQMSFDLFWLRDSECHKLHTVRLRSTDQDKIRFSFESKYRCILLSDRRSTLKWEELQQNLQRSGVKLFHPDLWWLKD